MKLFISLLLTLKACSSYANTVPKSDFGNRSNAQNAALNTAIGVLVNTFKSENIPKDSISGSCEYNEGSCNGAEVSLYLKDKLVYSSTLTNLGEFKIYNLKRFESYKFIITWVKHKLSQTREVTPGDYIQISIKK